MKELNEIGFESLYHKFHNESQGKESQPTFYLHLNLAKPYHIDYCFASRKFVDKLKDCTVGKFDNWKHLSDHSPLIVALD